jgi:hypothetical protein
VDLRGRGIAAELGFDVASGIDAGGIEIAEVVDVRRLALGLDRLGVLV